MKEWSRGLCGLLRRVLDEIVACIMYRQHSLYVRESDGTIIVSFRVIVVLNRESMYRTASNWKSPSLASAFFVETERRRNVDKMEV